MSQKPAGLILINGKIWTVNPKMPWADAIAIQSEKIIFVGSTDESKKYTGADTKIIDLQGKFAMPGFNDAHVHFDDNLIEEARKYGITTIQDISTPHSIETYRTLLKKKELTVRVLLRPPLTVWKDLANMGISYGGNMLKFIALKGYIDGMMGNETAIFFEPYCNNSQNYGTYNEMMKNGNMEELIRAAIKAGLPPHIHAIGDKANRILLDLFEKVIEDNQIDDHRFRVIHAQVVHPDDFKRFGDLKLVAEVNPYHCSADMVWMEEKIGYERCKGAYAFKSLKENGALLCFGSDYPGPNEKTKYPLNPLFGIYAAVTRKTISGDPEGGWFPEERLTIEEAIEAYTINPAIACFEEDIKGSIEEGKLADIVVLSKNILELESEELIEAEVVLTILGGQVVQVNLGVRS